MNEKPASTKISLWVKSEPFAFGILPVTPIHKLAPKFLRRIIPYAKTKKEYGFPKLNYSVWRHIACVKLQISEELAWLYFSTYHALTKVRPEDRIQWDMEFGKCPDEEREQLKNLATVDTMKFVLLLFIQSMNKNVRTSSFSSLSTEEWPLDQTRQGPSENGRTTLKENKIPDEHRYFQFIASHLEDILELLALGGDIGSKGEVSSISVDSLRALNFILEGSVDNHTNVSTLQDLVLLHGPQCGFSATERAFQLPPLAAWLKGALGPNPFGISSCLASGRRLSWPNINKEKEDKCGSSRRARMTTNALYAPKGKKVVVMTQIHSQTVARSSRTLRGAHVQIYRCCHSFIYLLSSLRCVSIHNCHDTTIVLGPVSSCIYVSNCKDVTVRVIARRLWISDTANSSFYLLVPTRPLIVGNKNDSITFAPYNSTYPRLDEQMAEAGLAFVPNFWNIPLCLSSDCRVEDSKCWQTLPPEEFFKFCIPFEIEGPHKDIPGELSSTYREALTNCERKMELWHQKVKGSHLTPEQQSQLQDLVQARFQSWLQSSGHQKELDGLVMLLHSSNRCMQ